MCAQCDEIDEKIAHYNRIAIHVTDQLTRDGIAALIKKLTDDKAAVDCEQSEKK